MSAVDEYLKVVAEPQKAQLERVRKIVRQLVPEAEEVISYGMPGFTYKNKYLMGYAAFKDHLSLFPTSAPVEALKAKLKDFKLSKGTIQFTVAKPVPETLIQELVKIRRDAILRS